jgi:predicted ATPase
MEHIIVKVCESIWAVDIPMRNVCIHWGANGSGTSNFFSFIKRFSPVHQQVG